MLDKRELTKTVALLWLLLSASPSHANVNDATPLNFINDNLQTFGDKRVRWVIETQSTSRSFRLENGFPPKERRKINRQLKKHHQQLAHDVINCIDPVDHKRTGYEDFTVSISYLNQDLLAYELRRSYFCKGSKTNQTDTSAYLYDIHSAQVIQLDEIITIPKAEKIRDMVMAEQEQQGDDIYADNDKQCRYQRAEIWSHPRWHFRAKGIGLIPSFPMITKALCEKEFLVRFETLQAIKNSHFRYDLANFEHD